MAADNDPNSAWSWDECKENINYNNLTLDDIKMAVKFWEDYPPYQPYTYIMGEQMAKTLDKEIMKSVDEFVTVTEHAVGKHGVGWNTQIFKQEWIDKVSSSDLTWTPTEPLKARPRKRDVDKFDYLLEEAK